MKLTHFQVKNFRCFDSLEMDLHPQLNVLGGINGAGKTALLDGIAIGLDEYAGSFHATKEQNFSKENIRRKKINHSMGKH